MLSAHASCLQASKVQPSSSNPDVSSRSRGPLSVSSRIKHRRLGSGRYRDRKNPLDRTCDCESQHEPQFCIACVLVRRVTYVADAPTSRIRGCLNLQTLQLLEANSTHQTFSQQFMAPRRLYISTPLKRIPRPILRTWQHHVLGAYGLDRHATVQERSCAGTEPHLQSSVNLARGHQYARDAVLRSTSARLHESLSRRLAVRPRCFSLCLFGRRGVRAYAADRRTRLRGGVRARALPARGVFGFLEF